MLDEAQFSLISNISCLMSLGSGLTTFQLAYPPQMKTLISLFL